LLRRFLEGEPNRSYKIVLYRGVVRYSYLIACADDQALPLGHMEAAQNELRRYQNLEAGPETNDRELAYRVCNAPLVSREGKFVLK
jgi:hypothetical protein